jgi:hypothetical protein
MIFKKKYTMKRFKIAFIFCSICFSQITVCAQAKKVSPKKEEVKIISTNNRAVFILDGFFTPNITKKILKQITANQLADVKKNGGEDVYPDCIKQKLEYNPAKPDEEAVTVKSLKLYRIARFDNIRNGENFGEQSILIAPAKENKNIGGDCSYEKDFYIMISTKDIEIIK